MAKKKNIQTLNDAKKLYKLLLWSASGGNLGTKPENSLENDNSTFAEKRGLLDSIIKIAQMEQKSEEDGEETSGLDMIRKSLNGGGKSGYRGNYGRTESDSDDPGNADEASENA